MSVVVSDLVARVRSEGVQEAKTAIQGVGVEAAQTARALEIMAAQFAKMQGGTAAQALEMFHRSGAQPTAAAMAEAAKQAEKTTAAVQAAVPHAQAVAKAAADSVAPHQAAARAAQDVGFHWTGADSSITRFAGALLGVNLGISVAAGAARALHQEIIGAAEAAISMDRVTRGLSAAYGAGAAGERSFATGLANQAGLSPSTIQEALVSARPLATESGLSNAQINQLTTRAADLAGQTGQSFDETFKRVLAGVSSGGNQLAEYGVRLDDVYTKTVAYNGALSGTYDKMTQAQQVAVRYKLFLDETDSAQGKAATSADTLSGAYDRLGASGQRLQEAIGKSITTGANAPAGGLAKLLSDSAQLVETLNSGKGISGPAAVDPRLVWRSDPNAPNGGSFQPVTTAPSFPPPPGIAAFAAGPPSFTGPLPLRASDLLGDPHGLLQSAAASAAAAAQAGIPDIGQASGAQLADLARRRAESSLLTEQAAQRNLANNQGLEGQLNVALGQATSPDERGRLSEQLATLKQYQAVQRGIVDAQSASVRADREQTEAQAQLSTIQLTQQNRLLDVAVQMAGYRTQGLQLEAQLTPILLNEANLQDKIAVASRDNLTSRRALTQAQEAVLPSSNALSGIAYQEHRLELLAETSLASILRGQGPTQDISALRRQYYDLQLQRPDIELRNLDAQRGVALVQQQQTAEDLTRQGPLTDLEAQRRAYEDQQLPLQENLRVIQAEAQSIQRSIELANLQDTVATTGAQRRQSEASALSLQAQAAARAAQDQAAALAAGYLSINDSAVALSSMRDILSGMPPLVVPTGAAADANGGARAPQYDPARAIDTWPGAAPAPAATQPYTTSSLNWDLPLATLPAARGELHPTHEGAGRGTRLAPLTVPPTLTQPTSSTGPITFAPVFHFDGATLEEMRQQMNDAFNHFFSGASGAGPGAPGSVAGAGR